MSKKKCVKRVLFRFSKRMVVMGENSPGRAEWFRKTRHQYKFVCADCGNDTFRVCHTPGEFYTGTECTKCGRQDCVHEG